MSQMENRPSSPRESNAICWPCGDQIPEHELRPMPRVSCRAPEPSADAIQSSNDSPDRFEQKTIWRPSGEKRARKSSNDDAATGCGGWPHAISYTSKLRKDREKTRRSIADVVA